MAAGKAARKPPAPRGKIPPWLQRWAKEAWVPLGALKPVTTMPTPTRISTTMATILMIANQNSISPKSRTVSRLETRSAASRTTVHAMETYMLWIQWSK